MPTDEPDQKTKDEINNRFATAALQALTSPYLCNRFAVFQLQPDLGTVVFGNVIAAKRQGEEESTIIVNAGVTIAMFRSALADLVVNLESILGLTDDEIDEAYKRTPGLNRIRTK